jgi:SAM-dependent methyltransferase
VTELFMSPPGQSFPGPSLAPSRDELAALCFQKYGEPEALNWGPRQRLRHSYFLPMDIYEAVVSKLVAPGCSWLDAGGGQSPFPENPGLARRLVAQCSRLVAVDPSENVQRNRFAHEREQCALERYESRSRFDLATMRMVVEHVGSPEAFVRALARLVRPGGVAVVLTVNLHSPVTLISRLLPFSLHRHTTRLLWQCDGEDVFPTTYRMNTRGVLRRLFEQAGFEEREFLWLDDLCIFGCFRLMSQLELLAWKGLHRLGMRYPENRLLGIYVRR